MLTFELDRLTSYDDEALLCELRRVAALVDSPYLSKSAFNSHSKAHSSGIQRRFGSWQQALQLAGLADRFSGALHHMRVINRIYGDDQLVAELRRVSAKIGGNPVTTEVFNQHADMNAATVRQRFGSWGAGLKQAGLEVARHGRRHSDEEYFENLLAVWTHYGRQPTWGQMNEPPSFITSSAYERKWGTWRKALLAFLERVNSDIGNTEPESTPPADQPKPALRRPSRRPRVSQEDQRQIKLGQRYEVLKRDRFRCVLRVEKGWKKGTLPFILFG